MNTTSILKFKIPFVLGSVLIISSFLVLKLNAQEGSGNSKNAKIAYVVNGEDGPVIYTVAPDGSDKTRLASGSSP